MCGSDESGAQGGVLGAAQDVALGGATDNVSRETWAHVEPACPGYWVFFPGGVRWISDEEQARHIAAKLESGTPPDQCFT